MLPHLEALSFSIEGRRFLWKLADLDTGAEYVSLELLLRNLFKAEATLGNVPLMLRSAVDEL